MDYQELLRKRDAYQEGKRLIPELTIASYERAFEIEYTHHSTAIEGNTLTLMETKLVLEDGISVGGKNLREIYEQVNLFLWAEFTGMLTCIFPVHSTRLLFRKRCTGR